MCEPALLLDGADGSCLSEEGTSSFVFTDRASATSAVGEHEQLF